MTDGTDPFAPFRGCDVPVSRSYADALNVTPVTRENGAGVTQKAAENRDCTPATPVTPRNSKGDRWRARAAAIETETGLPTEWAKAFATIEQMPQPKITSAARWMEIVADAHTFMWRGAGHAVAAGWCPVDAFGLDLEGASTDVGFVFLIRGGSPIVADDGSAAIQFDDKWTWFRPGRVAPGTPMIWDIDKPKQRPAAQEVAETRG